MIFTGKSNQMNMAFLSQVPGGYQDSLSKNTKLGKALDDACSELSHLGRAGKFLSVGLLSL